MKSSQKLWLVLAISGAALWAALEWRSSHSDSEPSVESVTPETVESQPPLSSSNVEGTTAPSLLGGEPSRSSPPSLGPHLRKIGECLGIQNSLNDIAEMSFSALNSSIQNELGGLVEKNIDWKNVHLTLPHGDKRRVRLEVEAVTEESSGLRLKYYGVDQEDLPVPLPLPEDQSLNPSESFVASLEGDGTLTLREEAFRSIYGKGAELYHVERNGVLSEVEILYHGRNVKCVGLQSPHGSCDCF